MRGVILVLGLGLLLLGGAGPILAQERPTLGPKNGPTSPPADLGRVKVGDPAPDFTLEALDGRLFTLSDYRGKKNIILVFYRGWW